MSYNNFDHDPIFVNVSVNTVINSNTSQNLQNSPAQIDFKNEDIIIEDPSQYYISLNRANLATSSIPAYIFPIQNGVAQSDINLSPFELRFEYYDAGATLIYFETQKVLFESQTYGSVPKPPSQNSGFQDFVNAPLYYFVYDIIWMLKIFNDNIQNLFTSFCANLLANYGITIDPTLFPFYTYDSGSKVFSLNFPTNTFDQSVYPRVQFYQDNVSASLFDAPNYSNVNPAFYTNSLMICNNMYNNTITYNTVKYFQMYGSSDPVNLWCPIRRVVFTISNVPIKRLELDVNYNTIAFTAQNNNSVNSLAKPNLPIFFDLNVSADQWVNRNYIEYTVSSIAESRLVSLGSGFPIQNFQINIYWLDVFNNARPLYAVANAQNSLKLAFYKKSTTLL